MPILLLNLALPFTLVAFTTFCMVFSFIITVLSFSRFTTRLNPSLSKPVRFSPREDEKTCVASKILNLPYPIDYTDILEVTS